MGTMIILGMQPDLILSGHMPCQSIILEVVAAIGNGDAGRRDNRRYFGCIILFLLFPDILFFFHIAKLDQFFLDLASCLKICLIQLFQQSFKVADLIFTDGNLFLQIYLSFLQLAVLVKAAAGIAAAIQLFIQRHRNDIIRFIILQLNLLFALGITDIPCIQQVAHFFHLSQSSA